MNLISSNNLQLFTFSDTEGHGDHSVSTGDSVQTADEIRQVVQHAQVMFYHNDVPEPQ